jgi:acyl dehydratase
MAALTPGQSWTTPGRTIGAGDINLFAGLVGDFTPIHVDETFAKSSPYGTRIAHGPLAMATAIGMLTQTGILGEKVIGLLNLNWDFSGPVKVDDTIRSRVTLETQRSTSKPGRAVATFVFEVINQNDDVVQRGRMLVLLRADDQSEANAENETGA